MKNKKLDMGKILTKFSENLIKNKWIVIGVFIVLIIASFIGSSFVEKESDVISYLDDDTVTIQGLTYLQENFNIMGDFSMGISYTSEDQVRQIINLITNCEHKEYINKVVWFGAFDDIPRLGTIVGDAKAETIAAELKSKFIISTPLDDGTTVHTYLINIYFTTPNSSDETIASIDEIEEILTNYFSTNIADNTLEKSDISVSDCYYFSGSSQNSRAILKSSIGDMPKFVIAAIIAVFVILLLTTRSYLEPVIFLATLGISIILNMGTNIIAGIPMGRISSITASCATILQLAVAMDYAIFLMHTYYEELRTTPNPKVAMIQALPKTIVSVVASSLTTVGGFVALFFMKFGIGYDLGFVLAKGVILSLITVICLQPIIILLTDKLIHKTEHKWSITPRLKSVSKVITKKGVAIPIIVVCIAVLIPACILQGKVDLTYITINEVNENPNLPEQILSDSSNQLIVLTPYKYENNTSTINGYANQYDFINKVYQIGYKSIDEYDSTKKYYYQDDKGKMQEIAAFSSEAAFFSFKDAHELYLKRADNTYYVSDDYYGTETYYIKDGDNYEVFNVASENAYFSYVNANPVFERDTNYSPISDIFSVCTILDKNDLGKVESSSFVRNIVYPLLMTNFVSNATHIENKKEVAFTDTEELHYILYTMAVDAPKENEYSYNTVEAIQKIASETFGDIGELKMTGNVVASKELSEVTPSDYTLVSVLSVLIIFLILLFTFRSPLLAVILVMVIETGIWANLSVTYLMGQNLHFMAYLIVTAIALGATVDYAILLTSKYLEEKKNGMTAQASIRNAIYRAAPGVLTSGSIFFVACLAVQLISTNIIVKQITALLARNAAISAFLVFTFLPAILSIKERIAKYISIKRGKGDPDEGKSTESIYSVSSKKLEEFAVEHGIENEAVLENKTEEQVVDSVEDTATPKE